MKKLLAVGYYVAKKIWRRKLIVTALGVLVSFVVYATIRVTMDPFSNNTLWVAFILFDALIVAYAVLWIKEKVREFNYAQRPPD